ncbi:hypothetical protein N9M21_08605 [Alphaproteobacteria bacterium]|nr:hypothetical protein [Alphaproteobacteria bacterium]
MTATASPSSRQNWLSSTLSTNASPTRTLFMMLIVALALLVALPSTAQAQAQAQAGSGSGPGSGKKSCKPVDIKTTITVEEIFDVDVRNTSFKAILNLNFRWRLPPNAPDLLKVNEVYQSSDISSEIWQPIYTMRGSRAAPVVDYSYFYMTRNRYGVRQDRILTDIIITDEFRDFPFGRIPLEIQLETLTNIAYKSDIKLCRSYSLSLAEANPLVVGPWQLAGAGTSTATEVALTIRQYLRHTPVFIIFKIIIPILVLTLISAITNINVGRSTDAARWTVVQVTIILVLITLRFALDNVLPEESYLTTADKMFAMALIAVFFAIISSICLHVLVDNVTRWKERQIKAAYRLLLVVFYGGLALLFTVWGGWL